MLQNALRLLKYFLIVFVLIVVAALCAIHYFINEAFVEKHLRSYVSSLFGTTLQIDGKIKVDLLPFISVDIPSTRVVKSAENETDSITVASFDKAHFDVALWSIPLGAKQIESIRIDGLKTTLTVPSVDSRALFDTTFSAVTFPKDLRVSDLTLRQASFDVLCGASKRLFQMRNVDLSLGKFSPEMKAPFEIRTLLKSDAPKDESSLNGELSRFLPVTIDTRHIDSEISMKGTFALSSARQYVMFDDLHAAAEFNEPNNHYTMALRADRLRLHGQSFSGMNVTATLSQPLKINGDIQLFAVDFKLKPESLISPEMRLSYIETKDNCTAAYEASGTVNADILNKKARFENIHATVAITGSQTLPEDFKASVSGKLHTDFTTHSAQADLSGQFTTVPFSYQGTIADLDYPKMQGNLALDSIDLLNLPQFKNLNVLSAISFDGALTIGQIRAADFTATQLKGTLALHDSKAMLSKITTNLAGGLVQANASLNDHYDWNVSSQFESVNLDSLFSRPNVRSLLAGISSGKFSLTGTGQAAQTLKGEGELHLRNGLVRGIDTAAAHFRIATGKTDRPVLGNQLSTELSTASAQLTLSGTALQLNQWVSENHSEKTTGLFALDLANNTISGTTKTVFAPTNGIPAIRLNASASGSITTPLWNFGWQESSQGFARAQGTQPKPSSIKKEKESDIFKKLQDFKNLKDFFKF